MADYYSLLAKLLDTLPDATPQVRTGVYDRARRALRDQLKTVQPSLSDEEIEREASGLEDAIRRLESRYESAPAVPASTAPDPVPSPAAVAPRPNPAPPPPPKPSRSASPVAIRKGGRRQPTQALLIALIGLAIPVGIVGWLWRGDRSSPPAPAPAPSVAAVAPSSQGDQKYEERVAGGAGPSRAPAASQAAERPAGRPDLPSQPTPEPGRATTPPSPPTAQGDRAATAPSVAASPPTAGSSLPPGPSSSAGPSPSTVPAGQQQPPSAGQPPPSTPPPPATGSAPSATNNLAVAQRAMIFEENQIDPQQPIITAGRAIWQLDSVSGGQGMPLETVIRGRVDLASAGLSLSIIVRRNLDAALPASHTIELAFVSAGVNNSPPRVVRDVALPVMRPDEAIRGVPVAGLPVPVKENVFLIGLSDLKADIERNTELLLRRNWIELPIRFASGQKAALLFDKGVSGERVFLDAFRQWGQTP